MLKIKLTILFFLFVTTIGYAQDLGLKHFTKDDGLPSNKVFNIYFDSKGYMWIATDKGIARYNGIDFRVFTTNDGLPDNEVFGFTEDYQGRLWISNFKGVLCYYMDNVFHTAANTPWLKLPKKSSSNFFNLFAPQKDSTILTPSVNGQSLLIIRNNIANEISLKKLSPYLALNEWCPVAASKINKNQFLLYYTHQFFIVDTSGNIVKKKTLANTTSTASIIENNKQYLHQEKGIYSFNDRYANCIHQVFTLTAPFDVSSFIKDKENIFSLSKNALYYNQLKILSGSNFSMVNHDNTGNIWLSTFDKGIYSINKNFNHSYKLKSRIENNIIASRIIGNTIHLVDENGNIYKISTTLDSSIFYNQNTETQPQSFTRSNTFITPSGDILSVQRPAIFYKKFNTKEYKRIYLSTKSTEEDIPIGKSINYIDSTFFIASMCHVIIIKEKELYKINAATINLDTLPFNTTTLDRMYDASLNKADTSLWISMADKTFRLKNRVKTIIPPLQNKTFRQLKFYGNYIIGITDDNSFCIYNTLSKSLDSLPKTNNIWESIYPINDSTAIINTSKDYKLITFYPSLKSKESAYSLVTVENPFIPKKADYIFGDGNTYYFLKDGVLSGFPAIMVNSKPLAPKPIFVSVETKLKTYAIAPLVDLPYNESKAITIQIDNISFNDKELITEYSISKDDKDNWNTITGNEINLNAIGMGYGKYTIKLRSKTGASDFSKPAILVINIATPFWAKWWFITLCILVFSLLILGVARLFVWRQVRKRQREFDSEMKYQQSEYKALNALMNPHFIFNSLNNIQGLINKDHKETANQYLVIFSKLIRQNMLNVSKGYISLYQEMILIENYLYLEKLRFKDLVNFTIEIGEEIDTETVMIPPLLIQPLVENAIIHGLLPMQSEASKLSIRIFEVDEVIHVEIVDNGVGLNQSLKKKNANSDSYGLSNLHRRIEHVKKFQKSNLEFEIIELVDENGKTLGTKASITIEQV